MGFNSVFEGLKKLCTNFEVNYLIPKTESNRKTRNAMKVRIELAWPCNITLIIPNASNKIGPVDLCSL